MYTLSKITKIFDISKYWWTLNKHWTTSQLFSINKEIAGSEECFPKALPLTDIFLYTKFHLKPAVVLKLFAGQGNEQMDGRTDRQSGDDFLWFLLSVLSLAQLTLNLYLNSSILSDQWLSNQSRALISIGALRTIWHVNGFHMQEQWTITTYIIQTYEILIRHALKPLM